MSVDHVSADDLSVDDIAVDDLSVDDICVDDLSDLSVDDLSGLSVDDLSDLSVDDMWFESGYESESATPTNIESVESCTSGGKFIIDTWCTLFFFKYSGLIDVITGEHS